MRFKLKNVPVPEAHVIGIILGVLLHLFFRKTILYQAWIGQLIGWPLIISGIGLSLWAAIEAGEMDISSPKRLLTSGPYAYSRNPMVVGWSLIFLGIALVVNSIYLIVLFPFIVAYSHFVDIRREEKFLEQEFGMRYREY